MEKQTRSVTVQWLIPFAALILVLLVMMFNFSTKSKTSSESAVTKTMTSQVEDSAADLSAVITNAETVGAPLADLIGRANDLEQSDVVRLANAAVRYSTAYQAFVCNSHGDGIDNAGNEVVLAGNSYFTELSGSEQISYAFSQDDNAVVIYFPVTATDYSCMLLYCSMDNFAALTRSSASTDWNTRALINEDGDVLLASGDVIGWQQGDNLFTLLIAQDETNGKKVQTRIGTNVSGLVSMTINSVDNVVLYAPLEVEGWTLVTTISQNYMDKQIKTDWSSARSMMWQLVVVFVAFAFLIIIWNILSDLHSKNKQKKLEEKADTDLLTGLNNKAASERKIREFMDAHPNDQSMFFILDIDNFKKINDTMGHAFGDEVLRSLGEQIGAIFRVSDVVGRFGGDEFVIFLKNIQNAETVRKEAQKVANFFKDFKAGEYVKYAATASIGVAVYPQEGADFDSLFKAADQALYKAKKRGKNQLAFYNEEWLGENSEEK